MLQRMMEERRSILPLDKVVELLLAAGANKVAATGRHISLLSCWLEDLF